MCSNMRRYGLGNCELLGKPDYWVQNELKNSVPKDYSSDAEENR